LKEFESADSSGRVKVLIEVCQKGISELEKLIDSANNRGIDKGKLIMNAKKHFDSADYMVKTEKTYNWGYVNAEDSSSGEDI